MTISQWSTTAATNATASTGVNWAEGQAPSTVNDSARQMMADVAAWVGQASGSIPEYLTGVAGTNTVTASGPSQMASYVAGQRFTLIPANTNTGATTLNITPSGASALGAKNVYCGGVACGGGEIVALQPIVVVYDGTQFNIPAPATLSVISRPNLLINPNWQIDQINEGTLYTAVAGSTVNGPDGWIMTLSGTATGVCKVRTLADPDNAALKCLEITCTTAQAVIGSDYVFIYADVEGYDAAGLMAGTASAQQVTLQFKLKSNVTGNFRITIANSSGASAAHQTITVPDTAEHEYSLIYQMPTTGTWLYTNGVGLRLQIVLAQTGQANFLSANTNVMYLKRIQLIPGALVQAYKPADIQKELAKCQRYYCKTFGQGVAPVQNVGSLTGTLTNLAISATVVPQLRWGFPVSMRAAPTMTAYDPLAADAKWTNSGATNFPSCSFGTANTEGVILSGGSALASELYYIHATANARLS